MTENEDIDIAQGLTELERIVEKLESEQIDIDRSVELFKQGVELADKIKQKLKDTELELKQVVENSDGSYSLDDLDI